MTNEHPLTAYIIEQSLTNRILANRLGITENYLSMIRHNRRLPSPKLVERICRVLRKEQGKLFPDYKERRRERLKKYRKRRKK